jgi:Tol biopolymer transport system component
VALVFSLILAGCGQPVREDRSINWSSEGKSVGFQHGQEGVFVADKDGKLSKIFQPEKDVIATSTPLWSPKGRKAIFTTARPAQGTPHVSGILDNDNPEGAVHLQRAVNYTCWYLDQETAEDTKPVPLFEASCDHVGYVAANLAVRWHPDGLSILHIKQINEGQHGLFQYELNTRESVQVFPRFSEAMIFDWTPDGSHLVCVLGDQWDHEEGGIWIGWPGEKNWWHVPQSADLAPGELSSLLEKLRASRPAWTKDGSRFAFASHIPGKTKDEPGRYLLRLGTLANHQVETLADEKEPIRNIRWAGDGKRLGLVRGEQQPSLYLLELGGKLSRAINDRPVRQFAGWNAKGDHLAYVTAAHLSAEKPFWAFLLVPGPAARDTVLVTDGAGKHPGNEVLTGMRVTFPQWSPTENKLSLWVTFCPPYRSFLSLLLRWGLGRGDPAAIFDLKTGQLEWMAVNPHEKVQVGHYYLMKRDYARAWKWYQEAENQLPAAKQIRAAEFFRALRNLSMPSDFSFFQYYCLMKLNRHEGARIKLAQFQDNFLPDFSAPPDAQDADNSDAIFVIEGKSVQQWFQELLGSQSPFRWLLQDLYVAEVFLSLDAAGDGEAFFQKSLSEAKTDPERLSHAIALAQVLLLEGKYATYAEISTKTLMPLLLQGIKPSEKKTDRFTLDPNVPLQVIGQLCLAPFIDPDFLDMLPQDQLRLLASSWKGYLDQAHTAESRQGIDRVLNSLFNRLGWHKEASGEFRPIRPTDKVALEARRTSEEANRAATRDLRKQIESLYQSTEAFLGRSP